MKPLENPFFNKIQNKLKNKITGIVSAQAFFFLIDTYLVNREKTIGKPKGIHRVGEKFSIIFSVS